MKKILCGLYDYVAVVGLCTLWLGEKTPKSILNTLWWMFTLHLGSRGRQEHHTMKIAKFSFCKEDNGKTNIIFPEDMTKAIDKMVCTKYAAFISQKYLK